MSAGRMQVVALERSDPKFEDAFVERLPTKLWSWEAPARPGEDDGIVRGAVAEAAVLDGVDSAQVGARRVVAHRLLTGQRRWAEQRGDDRQDSG